MSHDEQLPPADEPNPQLTQPELLESLPATEPTARPARAPAATFIFLTVMLDIGDGHDRAGAAAVDRVVPARQYQLCGAHALLLLSALLLLGYTAQQSLMNVYVLYTDYRYHWSDQTVGISLGVVGIFTIFYGAVVVRPATAKLGERVCIVIGLLGGTVGYLLMGLSKTGLLLWIGIPFLNLNSLTWPSAQSLMSRGTSKSEQGQLQGAINGLRGFSGIVGPGLFTLIFARSIPPNALINLPGMPFFAAATMLVLAIPIGLLATRKPVVAT